MQELYSWLHVTPNFLIYPNCYYISIVMLLTFLIVIMPYGKRCLWLVKAKVLRPHLHLRFLSHYQECLLTLMILAWTHFKKMHLYLRPKIQSSSSDYLLLEKTCVKKNYSLVVYGPWAIVFWTRIKGYNTLNKNCLLLICSYCRKYIYRFFYNMYCDLTIELYFLRSPIE